MMIRKLLPASLLVIPFVIGCAGPAKLAERSGDKLAAGDMWRAWSLATKALDKAPANAAAQSAAAAAAAVISDDWRRRIRALAEVDSTSAAEQAIEFADFRTAAAYYTRIEADDAWRRDEHAIRHAAARTYYVQGADDLASHRPKGAFRNMNAALRFVPGYRDAARLAEEAFERGLTSVAFVPLAVTTQRSDLGRDVAAQWRGKIIERMPPQRGQFTRVLPTGKVERFLRVSDLDDLSRKVAVRIGLRAGADRVVWGSIGNVDSKTHVSVYSDAVARKIVEKDADGRRVVRWERVPIKVVARVRSVAVELEHEVLATHGGATLARNGTTRHRSARVIWTAYAPEGNPSDYRLVSDPERKAHPDRAKLAERRWRDVVGEGTSLTQVLSAKRTSAQHPAGRRRAMARLLAGAAFAMLEELPSTEELALAALIDAYETVYEDLARLDSIDDVDLGLAVATGNR